MEKSNVKIETSYDAIDRLVEINEKIANIQCFIPSVEVQ